MNYVTEIQQLIGNTPLLELTHSKIPNGCRIFAKLEYFNPGGSVKDRLGVSLIEDAEKRGVLKPGGTMIEPTAGNTGIGLAIAAIGKGYRVKFVVPEKFSQEKQGLMRALGAEVINTPTEKGIKGAIEKAKELVEAEGAFSPSQFSNPANPETYVRTLGPEVWEALNGEIDVFIAGAGSGGTFMGTARYLKSKKQAIKTVIVEPEGSILNGGPSGPHLTEGIGMEFLPDYMDDRYFEAIYTITDKEAFMAVRELAKNEGLLVGSSSGAAYVAALREAEAAKPGSHIVTVFADSSERYMSQDIYGRTFKEDQE
ncbi:cysteine synthase family protein [Microbacterium sp. APC 3898]|jgi:O-acetylserine dependent cystathionine beta-synthase|uniref:Cysteine synthase family protein n=1 Tax=Planococcus notacanthi TaxID=3035188 RepID=A0ABT7ZL62_9BACL|nr:MULTISPECIES: cysteine synthase family protein [Terrabacteria group]MDN3427802.1 cysteine synthase family protein [Planococcus sp. APC 4016]MDN3437156.1 cysteine synthase family protein [Planococcus sp. APC 3900]MDN3499354.1 cysteine synthase family protein [Microbacterium sp. APC 3898]